MIARFNYLFCGAYLVAGATGNLGNRICDELVKRGAEASAIVRTSTNPEKIEALKKNGRYGS